MDDSPETATAVRPAVPQIRGALFLSDGGLETTLVFERGISLPHFAAFPLLADERGKQLLVDYYKPYLTLAARTPGAGFVLETPTWRASADWGERLGYDAVALAAINRQAGEFCNQLRRTWASRVEGDIVVAGIIGPRGDGYVADLPDSADEAAHYHQPQAEALRQGGVDMLIGVTMTSSAEAIGVARAAAAVGLPVAISFTVETDGRLPSGEALGQAIEGVDADRADARPAYFGINCAHPSHFDAALARGGAWRERIRAVRANASAKSHAELDAAEALDAGEPDDLAQRYVRLRDALPALNVLGGCCGTGEAHLKAIAKAWLK
jgi:S-methylmethionine-dependent homocysteine/selenocysteine methylase